MSRSNPHAHAPNPATRWFEWNGEHGILRYYDKAAQQTIDVPLPFSCLILDELASVRGWHKASGSGIYSNEVRDTRVDPFVVKAFKGGTLADGLYRDIKDRINTLGGKFVANCYIAFKGDTGLEIGSLRFKGGALGVWMEFRKAHRPALFKEAVEITGYTEGKQGRIVFRLPTFALRKVSEDTNTIARDLDRELQTWFTSYFAQRTTEQAEPAEDLTVPDEAPDDSPDTEPPF